MPNERDRILMPPDPPPMPGEPTPPALLPDLYAGELAAMGRMLGTMASTLARHALHLADLGVEALAVAGQLSEAASLSPFAGTPTGRMLEGMASRLRAALAKCQTG
jgi:Ser/Thr protein kinase RdoA (MazF antagonist)